MSIDLNTVLNEAVAAATRAGEVIVAMSREHAFDARGKFRSEIATIADLRADQLLRDLLQTRFPQHRFFSGEVIAEHAFDPAGAVWVVDPIDGTSNYAHGYPFLSISVALVINGAPCVGVVHAPFLDETYAAVRGHGATCNGRPIHVSRVSELRRALVGTGFPHDRTNLDSAMDRFRLLLGACQDVRRTGAPALDICWVAAGRLDAHCETLAPWDIAAAGLIATEAGALRGNLLPTSSSMPPALRGEEFVVATPGVFEGLCRLLRARAA